MFLHASSLSSLLKCGYRNIYVIYLLSVVYLWSPVLSEYLLQLLFLPLSSFKVFNIPFKSAIDFLFPSSTFCQLDD